MNSSAAGLFGRTNKVICFYDMETPPALLAFVRGNHLVEAEMSQKLSWRDLFVQIELGMDIASLGIK